MADLKVSVAGVEFHNPLIAASGTFGFGREYAEFYPLSALGGISSKGITLKARPGNPAPRIAEAPGGMLNAVGLQNPGVEGGDFRQATYRAVRHGLLQAKSVLLEPWYDFRLEVPQSQVGRAISDMQRLCAEFEPPQTEGENAVITGFAPVSEMQGYNTETEVLQA